MLCLSVIVCGGSLIAKAAPPQKKQPPPVSSVDVLMLSDLHFDPFYDPARMGELKSAPISQWPAILSKPASEGRVGSFAELQSGCGVRGTDSPWPLIVASLREATQRQRAPLFVTVSGD